MKKLITILILGTITFSACTANTEEKVNKKDIEQEEKNTELSRENKKEIKKEPQQSLDDVNSNYSNALKSGDSSKCDSIKNKSFKKDCIKETILSKAINSKDKNVCSKLEKIEDKENCKNLVEKE